jgi:hypothetical protein
MSIATSSPSAAPTGNGTLQLDGEAGRLPSTLHGTWAPGSASLNAELPALVAELHRRGIRIVRVAFNPTRWDPAPRTVPADGRVVHLGLFHSLTPNLLILQGTAGERVDLTVPLRAAP